MYGYAEDKDLLVKRLHRIEGQVRGIERMVEDERYCIDILTQIAATRAALDGVALKVLEDHVQLCVRGRGGEGSRGDGRHRAADSLALGTAPALGDVCETCVTCSSPL